jgi:hypothetical protein
LQSLPALRCLTYVATAGFVYVTVVVYVFSLRIVGWRVPLRSAATWALRAARCGPSRSIGAVQYTTLSWLY